MKRSLILTALSFLVLAQPGWGQVPQTISYQGVLRDVSTGELVDGIKYATFSIYESEGATAHVWTSELQSVTVTNGIFHVKLGSATKPLPDPFPSQAWLGIKVDPDTEEMPRIELTTVPYSLSAGFSDSSSTAEWSAASDYADTSDYSYSTEWSDSSDWSEWSDSSSYAEEVSGADNVFPGDGSVGIGTTSPLQKLHVKANSGDSEIRIEGSSVGVASTARVSFYDSTPTRIGYIGDVSSGTDDIYIVADADNALQFYTGGQNRLHITNTGDVGIGITTPAFKLEVAGDANIGGTITIPATTRYYSIPATAFQPFGGGNVPYIADEDMGMMPYNISAPVHLPHGAIITEFSARVYDGHATDITVSLMYAGGFDTEYTNIITMTSGWEGGDVTLENTLPPHTVNNINNVYVVAATWMSPPNPDQAEIKFRNALIGYTVTTPLP